MTPCAPLANGYYIQGTAAMIETIHWRAVTKGRIGVDAPPPKTKVLVRLDTGEITQTFTRLADGWLGCNVRYWSYPEQTVLKGNSDE